MPDSTKKGDLTDTGLSQVPKHVAIIMDGNGRWAKQRGWPRAYGHRRGVDQVREITEASGKQGVRYLTLFAFSSENWQRPATEVRLLTDLLMTSLEKEVDTLHKNDIRLRVIGDLNPFGVKVHSMVKEASYLTRQNATLNLTLAVNYGGHWDITNACQQLIENPASLNRIGEDITKDRFESKLSTADLPAPDLFIRTGGEQRLSNFLLWQLAYTELYFTDTLWPDFDADCFYQALLDYQSRQRRFGRTSEQVA